MQPVGNTLGALTGFAGQIEFIEQTKRSPWVQQYSLDVERLPEWPRCTASDPGDHAAGRQPENRRAAWCQAVCR
jgi:hypothetical protein